MTSKILVLSARTRLKYNLNCTEFSKSYCLSGGSGPHKARVPENVWEDPSELHQGRHHR